MPEAFPKAEPLVDDTLIAWLDRTYPVRPMNQREGESIYDYALRCSWESGRQQVVDKIKRLNTFAHQQILR